MAAIRAVGRLSPPPRRLALEADDCLMVQVQADPTEYKVAARDLRPIAGSPRFVVDRCRKPVPAWARLAPCSRPSTPLRAALRWPSASVDRRGARRVLVCRPGRRNAS